MPAGWLERMGRMIQKVSKRRGARHKIYGQVTRRQTRAEAQDLGYVLMTPKERDAASLPLTHNERRNLKRDKRGSR